MLEAKNGRIAFLADAEVMGFFAKVTERILSLSSFQSPQRVFMDKFSSGFKRAENYSDADHVMGKGPTGTQAGDGTQQESAEAMGDIQEIVDGIDGMEDDE